MAFAAFSSVFLTVGALPYWAVQGGASVGQAGLVTTVLFGGSMLAQLFVSRIVGRFGYVLTLLTGLGVLGAPAPLYLLDHSLWWLLVVSAIRGIGFGFVATASVALLSLVAPAGRRSEAFGVFGIAVNVPNLAAIPLGVALVFAGRFDVVSCVAAVPCLALLATRRLTHTAAPHEPERPRGRMGPPRWSAVSLVAMPTVTLIVACIAISGLRTFIPIELGVGRLPVVALLAFGLTSLLVRWRVGRIADKVGAARLLPLAILILAVGMAVLAAGLATSGTLTVVLVLTGAATVGFGFGGAQNLTLVVALDRGGRQQNVAVSAIWNLAFDLGVGAGSFLIGALAVSGLGVANSFLACAVLAALTAGLARARQHVTPAASSAASETGPPRTKTNGTP